MEHERDARPLRRNRARARASADASFRPSARVLSVARSRCEELFNAPGSVTLWHLPAEIEDQFDEHWQAWIGAPQKWNPFFDDLTATQDTDLLSALRERELISDGHVARVQTLRRAAEGARFPSRDTT